MMSFLLKPKISSGKIQPFTENHPGQNEKKSIFEKITSLLSRSISKVKKTDDELLPPSLESKIKMREQTSLVLKEVMYNSVAQAILKIFHTPHLTLKLTLILFVLLTTGIR